MKHNSIVAIFVATLLLVPGISQAEEKPDFSGTWKVDPDLPPSRMPPSVLNPGRRLSGMGCGWGGLFTITQTSELLEIERPVFAWYDMQPQPRFGYSLTGDRRTNSFLNGWGLHSEDSTARWEGDTLVITTLHPFRHPDSGEEVKYEVKQVLSLAKPKTDSGSPSLVIETTRAGVLGGTAATTRTVFHKE